MVRYPVVLEPDDNGTVMVTFADFPEAQTFGEDEADAIARASDALATIVDGYIRARRPLPAPSAIHGPAAVLSPLMSAKAELYNAMHEQGVTKSALGRRLNWHAPQVDRLLTLTHSTQVDQIDAAARALGGTLLMRIEGLPERKRVVYGTASRAWSVAASVSSGASRQVPTAHPPSHRTHPRKPAARKK